MSALVVAALFAALLLGVLVAAARFVYVEFDAVIQDQNRYRRWLDDEAAAQRERHAKNRSRRAAMRGAAPKGENP